MPRLFAVNRTLPLFGFVLCCGFLPSAAAQTCGSKGIVLQVLGSGGPELQDKRASSSYLIWQDGQARVLVDAGGGSALRFGESGAQMSQLDVILFSHFHVDHSGDFPVLIKSSWFEDRKRPLPVYGPEGNDFMPSTVEFVYDFFGDKHGTFRYLERTAGPERKATTNYSRTTWREARSQPSTSTRRRYRASGARGPRRVPALAWRVEMGGKVIVFSGDANGEGPGLLQLAANADLFVAHNAVPEGVTGVERNLHMPPSVIGQIAGGAHVKQLVLSHRMLRTLGKESQTQSEIEKRFSGPLTFANDLDCFPLN